MSLVGGVPQDNGLAAYDERGVKLGVGGRGDVGERG